MANRLHRIALMVPCSYCKAVIDEPCKTRSGRSSQWPHATRLAPVWEANSLGYCEGMRDAERWPESVAGWVKHFNLMYGDES